MTIPRGRRSRLRRRPASSDPMAAATSSRSSSRIAFSCRIRMTWRVPSRVRQQRTHTHPGLKQTAGSLLRSASFCRPVRCSASNWSSSALSESVTLVQETDRVTAPAPYEFHVMVCALRARRTIRSRCSGGKHVATSALNSAMAARYKGAAFLSQGISGENSFMSNGHSNAPASPASGALRRAASDIDPLARAMRLGRCGCLAPAPRRSAPAHAGSRHRRARGLCLFVPRLTPGKPHDGRNNCQRDHASGQASQSITPHDRPPAARTDHRRARWLPADATVSS